MLRMSAQIPGCRLTMILTPVNPRAGPHTWTLVGVRELEGEVRPRRSPAPEMTSTARRAAGDGNVIAIGRGVVLTRPGVGNTRTRATTLPVRVRDQREPVVAVVARALTDPATSVA